MEKVAYVWTEINKTEDEVANKLTDEDAGTHAHANSVTYLCYLILYLSTEYMVHMQLRK